MGLKTLLNIVAIVAVAILSYRWGSSNVGSESKAANDNENSSDIPSKITLHYFDARWTTETVRLLLKYGGIEFEDHRVEKSVWGDLKTTMPFGHLPVIEVDGKKAAQSIAIARYVAKIVKLAGANDWENLEIDAVVDTLNDIKEKLSTIFGEKDEKAKEISKETHLKETLPYYFEKLEAMAKSNNGYLVGKKLTWADFYFTVICDVYAGILGMDIVERYPNLVKVRQNVLTLPAVKTWINTRPKTDF